MATSRATEESLFVALVKLKSTLLFMFKEAMHKPQQRQGELCDEGMGTEDQPPHVPYEDGMAVLAVPAPFWVHRTWSNSGPTAHQEAVWRTTEIKFELFQLVCVWQARGFLHPMSSNQGRPERSQDVSRAGAISRVTNHAESQHIDVSYTYIDFCHRYLA